MFMGVSGFILKAIRVHEEAGLNLRDWSFYSTYKAKYDANWKTTDKYAKKTEGYGARVAHVEDDSGSDKEHDSDASEPNEKYEEAYYQGVIQAMEMNDEMGQCFNCNESGHKW